MPLPASFKILGSKKIDGVPHVVIEDTLVNLKEQKSVVGDVYDVVRRVNKLYPNHRIVLREKVGLTEIINEDGQYAGFAPFQSPKRDRFISFTKEMLELARAEDNGERPDFFGEIRKNRQGRLSNGD